MFENPAKNIGQEKVNLALPVTCKIYKMLAIQLNLKKNCNNKNARITF